MDDESEEIQWVKDLQEENIKLKADLREARMQSLADLGQAQDALEAQKKAEAERDTERLAAELFATKDSAARVRLLSAALGETENG